MALRQRLLRAGERIRVLVVDDSVVIRRLVTHALESDPLIEVVGAAANGAIALQRIEQLNPDVLTLDIEMPEMDGLELLRRLRGRYPQMRIIMFSTLTERGAAVTFEALALGADDYVPKASNAGSLDVSLERLRSELIPKIKQFFVTAAPPAPASREPALGVAMRPDGAFRPQVVAIGVSTGGPAALGRLVPALPADFPLPVLIVQHMPPLFTRLLAERLDAASPLTVKEAAQGEPVEPGKVLIAPGDYHLKVGREGATVRVVLEQSPPLNSCRPAVDALFSALADVYGGAVLAVVLTGMGYDGLRGAELLKAAGARLLAQDEATSVVWGMPGAVVSAGLADRVVPLDQMAAEITRLARRS